MNTTNRVRGEVKNATEAIAYWYESTIFGPKRDCKDKYDFGDTQTVGVHLKRTGFLCYDLENSLDFGRFLGEHKDGWVVAICAEDFKGFCTAEVFKTLEDLKRSWELD